MPRIAGLVAKDEKSVYHVMSRTADSAGRIKIRVDGDKYIAHAEVKLLQSQEPLAQAPEAIL